MKVRYLVFTGAVLILLWAMWGELSVDLATRLSAAKIDSSIEKAGQWGDSFGAFNALTSIAAFGILLATLTLQARATRDQAIDLHRERFERTFFELLRLMRELRKEVSFSNSIEYRN